MNEHQARQLVQRTVDMVPDTPPPITQILTEGERRVRVRRPRAVAAIGLVAATSLVVVGAILVERLADEPLQPAASQTQNAEDAVTAVRTWFKAIQDGHQGEACAIMTAEFQRAMPWMNCAASGSRAMPPFTLWDFSKAEMRLEAMNDGQATVLVVAPDGITSGYYFATYSEETDSWLLTGFEEP